jgi:hypothetical protein
MVRKIDSEFNFFEFWILHYKKFQSMNYFQNYNPKYRKIDSKNFWILFSEIYQLQLQKFKLRIHERFGFKCTLPCISHEISVDKLWRIFKLWIHKRIDSKRSKSTMCIVYNYKSGFQNIDSNFLFLFFENKFQNIFEGKEKFSYSFVSRQYCRKMNNSYWPKTILVWVIQ